MRSSSQSSPRSAMGRIRPWVEKARRSFRAQKPAVRWGLALAVVAVLLLLGYVSTLPLTSASSSYLASGRRFSSDDVIKVARALDHLRIDYRIDDLRRVSVPADHFESAAAAVAKLELGPRSLDEIRERSTASSLWESVYDRGIREHQRQEDTLRSLINELDGIVGSFVWISRPKERWGTRDAPKCSAFVRLETEGDRQLPFRTIQSITRILTGAGIGIAPESITVRDRRHEYLVAGNPALSAFSHSRAREEEWSELILEKLDWIKGVRVSVQIPDAANSAAGRDEPSRSSPPPPSGARPSTPPSTIPAVAINRPLSLEPEPAAGPGSPGATPSLASDTAESPATSPSQGVSESTAVRGRVWVRVPRSYYYNVSILPSHKEPTVEELQKLVVRTEEQIKTGIGHVVPLTGAASWEARVDVIPDEMPLTRPPIVGSAPDARRVTLDWGIAGAIGAMAAAVVTTGAWILSTRRPIRRQEMSSSIRYHRGAPTLGPSERVREFVRRNPESAVSVLERWTSQGGDET